MNAFTSLINAGQSASGKVGNVLNRFSNVTEQALMDPALKQQQAQQAAEAEAKKQQAQFAYIQNSAAFLDSLTPELQKGYLDLNGPALVEQGVLDEEDLPLLYQNIGVPNGFTGLARSAIDPNQQQQNAFEVQRIAETGRSNIAGEAIARGNLDVNRGNLDVSRGRLALDQQTRPNAINLERTKADREVFKDTQALRKEFSQVTTDFQGIQRNVNNINTLGASKNAAGDLALIVSFTKLLDPGSVAREGEVTLSQSAASAIDQATIWLERLKKGNTLLPDATRAQFIQAANELAEQYQGAFQTRQQEFRTISEAGQIDPNLVLIGSSDPRAPNPNAQGAIPQGVTEEDITFTMQKYGVSREEVLRRIGAQ